MDDSLVLIFRLVAMVVLVGFLPVSAFTYFTYRLGQRKIETERILRVLGITSTYRNIYVQDIGKMHFSVAVLFTVSVATIGLASLILSNELGLADSPSLLLAGTQLSNPECDAGSACLRNYQHGAMLAFGLGFLGAYLWGMKGVLQRYSMNDLLPLAYYHFGLRMILASFVALIIYHAVGGFSADYAKSGEDATTTLIPTGDGVLIATVFFVGMFPQRGIRWLTSKIGFGSNGHASVKALPLNMIEGMNQYDIFRLEELGIDTCYDLANADFIPLLLKTSYGARELIDWLLQAKLCVRFGDNIVDLRAHGIRTLADLEGLDDSQLESLSKETSMTFYSLQNATLNTGSDQNSDRLMRAAELLSSYWEGDKRED
jgi:hypothetical protein